MWFSVNISQSALLRRDENSLRSFSGNATMFFNLGPFTTSQSTLSVKTASTSTGNSPVLGTQHYAYIIVYGIIAYGALQTHIHVERSPSRAEDIWDLANFQQEEA